MTTPMTPSNPRPTLARGSGALQITGALRQLGVPETWLWPPRRRRKSGGFWRRQIHHVGVLELARRIYRVRIKSVHPDVPGGAHVAARDLNALWRKIRTAFARFGHTLE